MIVWFGVSLSFPLMSRFYVNICAFIYNIFCFNKIIQLKNKPSYSEQWFVPCLMRLYEFKIRESVKVLLFSHRNLINIQQLNCNGARICWYIRHCVNWLAHLHLSVHRTFKLIVETLANKTLPWPWSRFSSLIFFLL